jgi:hypothetical protein
MATPYTPPKQSIGGQFFDVGFLLALVFGALFLPIWLNIAAPSRVEKLPAGVSYVTGADGAKKWSGVTWEKLGQNPTMQGQWKKLGYDENAAAAIITQPFDYTIDVFGVIATAIVIGAYFIFLMFVSEREYKQVIAEKFD